MTPEQELKTKDNEIERLRKEIELIELQKRQLESKYDLVNTQRQIEQKTYESTLSIAQLKFDWLAAAKELESLKANPDVELRNALCIQFANQLRFNALAEMEKDDDAILVTKAIAYESFYRASLIVTEQRKIRVRLVENRKFEEVVKEQKEKKNAKVREKVEKERSSDPREKMILTYMSFGASREDAEKQADLVIGMGKELSKK